MSGIHPEFSFPVIPDMSTYPERCPPALSVYVLTHPERCPPALSVYVLTHPDP